jgi:hypothetical protein
MIMKREREEIRPEGPNNCIPKFCFGFSVPEVSIYYFICCTCLFLIETDIENLKHGKFEFQVAIAFYNYANLLNFMEQFHER